MRRVAKFAALPREDRWLLVRALATVAAVRLRLACLPFRAGKGYMRRLARGAHPCNPERVAWAVDHAGRFFGEASCLVRALAGHRLLAGRGVASWVRIGVAPGEPDGMGTNLAAHAWLETKGRIVLGGPDVGRYRLLLTWGNEGREDFAMAEAWE